jgi:lipopolysaccharide export system permease protein
MFGSILHRMIFRELIRVFVLCLIGITGILLLAGIVAEASQQGLNPGQILAIIPLLIPSTLPYTIPATTLFATCVVYGRLSADNEILALRASGINMTRVVWPGILLGLMTSGTTLGLYYHVIPYTHHLMRTMFLDDVEELLYAMLRRNNQLTFPHSDYSMFVQSVQGRRLLNPRFKHKDTRGDTDIVAVAREAELRVDLPRQLILVKMKFGEVLSKDGANVQFDDRIFEIPLVDDLNQQYVRPRDMTWQELFSEYEKMLKEEEKAATDVEKGRELLQGVKKPTEEQQAQLKAVEHKFRLVHLMINALIAEMHMRPALSLGCFFFVLIGCPVGIWFSRSDYLSSFITCFLPIVFIYYPLILCGTGMAKDGKYPPLLTVWAADMVMAVVGLEMFRRLLKN